MSTRKLGQKNLSQQKHWSPYADSSSMVACSSGDNMEKFSREWCRRRRFRDIHIVRMLARREIGNRKAGTHLFSGSREFYQCIHPSKEVSGIDLNVIMKKFSPDGRFLICFLTDFHTISVRNYAGLHPVLHSNPNALFDAVFPERFAINLCLAAQDATVLNKDCVFITRDSRHLIVATETQILESQTTISQTYTNNESLQPLSSQALNTICFYCIDLKNGIVCDTFTLTVDRVWVAHGVHLVGRLLAVFSLQQQTIHFLQIDRQTGHFMLNKQLGRFLYDDDNRLMSLGGSLSADETVFTGLKQRLLTFLFHKFAKEGKVDYFLRNFAYLCDLRIWQIQLVLPDIVLLRFVNQDAFVANATINTQPAYFVFMNWRTSDILAIFDQFPNHFLWIVENFHEDFKYPHITDNRFPITMQHCQFDYERHCRLKYFSGSNGGLNLEVQKRILSQLPYSTAYASTETPYLDPVMFSYDDFLPSLIERMKLPAKEKLRFFSRVTSQPLFEMELNAGRSIQLLFHPQEPFAISFDRALVCTTGTFHVPAAALQQA